MKPFIVRRSTSQAFPMALVAAETFMGFVVVYERPSMPELGPLGVGVLTGEAHEDRFTGKHPQYSRADDIPLQSFIQRLKTTMLAHGASAEAVRLIGEHSPFTKKELNIMAEKLKAKKVGDAAALKEAAKTAPVAKGKATAAKAPAEPKPAAEKAAPAKGKGNTEALDKARAAKTAGDEKKKITVNTKENPYRDGTKAFNTFNVIKRSKTVGAFREAVSGDNTYDPAYLRYAERDGHITIA